MGLKIDIYGINDRSVLLPEWVAGIKKTHYQLQEIPTNDEKNNQVSDFLNDRKAPYFNDEELFVKTVNDYLKKEVGVYVNEMLLRVAYNTKEKYDFCYPVGCLNNFAYKNPSLENNLRFNRSVKITNNILEVLRNYSDILMNRIDLDEKKYFELNDFEKLLKEYRQGKKMKVMEGLVQDVILHSGLTKSELTPKIAREVIEDLLPISYTLEAGKVYANPGTFRKVFSKTMKEFNPEEVVILIGEPHRIFLEYFLKKEYSDVSSTPKTLDFLETKPETKWVRDEIDLAEQEKLIKF